MTKQRIGVIGIPGKWSTETLADAIEHRTGFRLVIDMAQVELDLQQGRLFYQGQDLCELDALLVKKISREYSPQTLDRLELLRIAEQAGVRVYSPVESMLRLVNRLSCSISLRNAGIPMPATRVCEDLQSAINCVKEFSVAVFKPLYSTKARGMCIIDANQSEADLSQQIRSFQQDNPVMYIQQKIKLPGQDLGMAFLNGEYIGTYARIPQTDSWNTTINSGGRYAAYTASQELVELAHRAQAPFQLSFTTVDVAETDDGPIVFEVSAFGGFRGLKQAHDIAVAERYADFVLSESGNKP